MSGQVKCCNGLCGMGGSTRWRKPCAKGAHAMCGRGPLWLGQYGMSGSASWRKPSGMGGPAMCGRGPCWLSPCCLGRFHQVLLSSGCVSYPWVFMLRVVFWSRNGLLNGRSVPATFFSITPLQWNVEGRLAKGGYQQVWKVDLYRSGEMGQAEERQGLRKTRHSDRVTGQDSGDTQLVL